MRGTLRRGLLASSIGAVALAIRLPTMLSSRHLGYDEGVYGASVDLMAAGFVPYRDFFSSQGPVYLPILRALDLTGVGGFRAPRLAILIAAVAIAGAVFVMVRRDGDDTRAWAAASLVATSGLMLLAVTPLHSVGIATAFGMWALVLATGPSSTVRTVALSGVLAALAIATKSLLAVPVALATLAVVTMRGGAAMAGLFAVCGAATGLLVSLPFGPAEVWDQYVVFHTEKTASHSAWANLTDLAGLLLHEELPLVVAVTVGIVVALVARRPIVGSQMPAWLLVGWLAVAIAVVAVPQPLIGGFERFAVVLVPPAALLAARLPIPTPVLLAVAIVALPFQWFVQDAHVVHRPSGEMEQVIEAIAASGTEAHTVADDPGIVWIAGGLSHPDTVDSSFARINTGRVTSELVSNAAEDPTTCAYLSWSTRFASLGLDPVPSGYTAAVVSGHRAFSTRSVCG